MEVFGLIIIGLAAGVLSGLLGIGGATLVIPALIYLYGMSQHMAQGTTLAMMIPPIGLLAAFYYWRQGNVNIGWAAIICVGFFFGGLLGAYLAGIIPDIHLKRIFGMFLLILAVKFIFWG